MLYDHDSAGDQGTLFAARNFLNARNVPTNPMNDVDATFDFLEQYTEALILAAFEEAKEKHSLNLNVPELQQDHLMNFILDQIFDNFALPSLSSEWNTDEDIFKCKECGKTYKKWPL